jgi:hypothetical protein
MRIAVLHAALMLSIFTSSQLAWTQTDNLWRRTAVGWERVEGWYRLTQPGIPNLKPLTVETLLERTWPATVAFTELAVVLLILTLSYRDARSIPSEDVS